MKAKTNKSSKSEENATFYKEQLDSLKDMMSRTTSYMEMLQSELKKKNREIEQSVNYAQNIQHNLLPKSTVFKSQFKEYFYDVRQRDIIGGDMIYAKQVGDEFIFALMDCTGHGIPGALLSMLGYTFLDRLINSANSNSPSLILKALDLQFKKFFSQSPSERTLTDGMDGILCCYHKRSKILKYSLAGRPLWYHHNGEWHRQRPAKSSIGGSRNKGFETICLSLDDGDEIFIFSDGLTDQFGGPHDKKFLTKRALNCLINQKKLNLTDRFQNLVEEVFEWKGKTEQTDDISLLALKL